MTASLSQMSAAAGFVHLMLPPVWSRALTQALVTGPSKSLDPDSGTVCRLHCVEFYLYPTVGTVLIHSVKPELTE